MRNSRGFLALVPPAALALWPSIAMACASCMNDDPIWQRKLPILLGFIGFPFLLAGAAFFAIRRFGSPTSRSSSENQE